MKLRIIIAIALFTIAGIIAVRTMSSSGSARTRHVEQPVMVVASLPLYDSVRLVKSPNGDTLARQIRALRQRIFEQAMSGDLGLSSVRASALADSSSNHFRVLVSGDYDAWVAIVDAIGSNPRGVFANNGIPFESEAERLAFKQSWDNATKSMRFARFDPERVMLRWTRRDGETIDHEPPPQALPTSFDGGFQSVVEKQYKNSDLIEVIVPIELTMPGASEQKPLYFAAMTFALPENTDIALPYSMMLYSVKTIGGSLVLPAF